MSVFISSPPTGLAHPLQGWFKAITYGADHAGFNATLLPLENLQTTLLVWRSGLTHAARPGAELKLLVSHDEGASFEGLRSIYQSSDWDTRNFAGGVMGRGRVGIVAARFRGAGSKLEHAPPVFVYSDDGGVNWVDREMSHPPTGEGVNFHGDIIRWPASAGGDDNNGFAAFSYNFVRKSIDAAFTRDNGESWVWKTDIVRSDGVLADCLTETWVSPLGPDGPWLMTARSTTTGQQRNLSIMTSRNLTEWDGPRDGGVLLSGNAPALIIEDGEAFLYTVARRGHKRELPNTAGEMLGNRLLVAHAPAAAVVDGSTDFSLHGGWKEVATLPDQAVGYIFPRKLRRRWFAAFNCGETGYVGLDGNKRSWLGLMTPHPPLLVDAPTLRMALPHDNHIDNGEFSSWSRGERIERTRPGQMTADRWSVEHPAIDAVTVEKVSAPHPLGGASSWFSKRCPAPSGKGPHRTVQRIAEVGLGAEHRVTLMFRAWSPSETTIAAVKLVQHFGTGGSKPVEVILERRVRLSRMPLLYSLSGALASVADKQIAADASLRIVIEELAPGDSGPVDISFGDVALVLAPVATSVRRKSADEVRAACERYFRILDLATISAAGGLCAFTASFSPMARLPIVRLLALSGAEASASALIGLERNGVRLLARGSRNGGPCSLKLQLDAEWTGSGISGPVTRESADSDIVRAADGRSWLSSSTSATLGFQLAEGRGVDHVASLVARLEVEHRLRDIDRELLGMLASGIAVDRRLLEQRNSLIETLAKDGG